MSTPPTVASTATGTVRTSTGDADRESDLNLGLSMSTPPMHANRGKLKFDVGKQSSQTLACPVWVCPVCDKTYDEIIALDRHHSLTRHGQSTIFGTKYEHMEPYKQAIAHFLKTDVSLKMDMEQQLMEASCFKQTDHEAGVKTGIVDQNLKDLANSGDDLEDEPNGTHFKDLLSDFKEEKCEIEFEHPDSEKKECNWLNIKQEQDIENDSEIKEEIVCHNQGQHDEQSSLWGDIKAPYKELSQCKRNSKKIRTESERSVKTQSMLFSERELKFSCLEIIVFTKNRKFVFPRDENGESFRVACTLNPDQAASLGRMPSYQELNNPMTVVDESLTGVDKPQPNGDMLVEDILSHRFEDETNVYDDIPHNRVDKPFTGTLDEDHTVEHISKEVKDKLKTVLVNKFNTVVNEPCTDDTNPLMLVKQHHEVRNKPHPMSHKAHTHTIVDTCHTYKCKILEDQSHAILDKSHTPVKTLTRDSQYLNSVSQSSKMQNKLKEMQVKRNALFKSLLPRVPCSPIHGQTSIHNMKKEKEKKKKSKLLHPETTNMFDNPTFANEDTHDNIHDNVTDSKQPLSVVPHPLRKDKGNPPAKPKQSFNEAIQTRNLKSCEHMTIDMNCPHEVVFPEEITPKPNQSEKTYSRNIATQIFNKSETQNSIATQTFNRYFACFICMEKFASEEFRTEHMFLHHQFDRAKSSFFLKKDDYALTNSNNLEEESDKSKTLFAELLEKRKKDEFKKNVNCFVCGKEFSRKLSIMQHILQSHFRVNIRTLQERKITNKLQGFINWENTELEEQVTYSKKECVQLLLTRNNIDLNWFEHECTVCRIKYIDKESLEGHMLLHTPYVISQLREDRHLRRKLKKEKEICYLCGQLFEKGKNLEDHLKLHEDENSFQCEICKISYGCLNTLANHRKVHTGEPSSIPMRYCEICGKKYPPKSFKLHMAMQHNTGEKLLKCSICKKSFAKETELMRHRKEYGHHIVKNHKCTVCGAKFALLRGLKIHLLRKHVQSSCRPATLKHSKHLKTNPCEECGKVFASKHYLDFHIRTAHKGEPLPRCPICCKAISALNLTNHMKVHTNKRPFECETCHFKSKTRFNLTQHKRIHTGEKPFPCRICGVKFRQQGDRGVHEKRHVKRGETTEGDLIKARSGKHGQPGLSSHSEQGSGDKPVAEKLKGND